MKCQYLNKYIIRVPLGSQLPDYFLFGVLSNVVTALNRHIQKRYTRIFLSHHRSDQISDRKSCKTISCIYSTNVSRLAVVPVVNMD